MIGLKPLRQREGFTLVELMIVLLISAIVMTAIFSLYQSQRKLHVRQEQVVDIQQNLRSGLYLLTQELRMAGYDPQGTAGAIIQTANGTQIRFTQDITNAAGTATDGNGVIDGPNEDVTLAYDAANLRITRDNDGPGGVAPQPFINNVDFLEFWYTMEDDNETLTPPAGFLDQIRTIQVTMIVRASQPDIDYLNNFQYTRYRKNLVARDPALDINPLFNDNFRRKILTTTIQCRNATL